MSEDEQKTLESFVLDFQNHNSKISELCSILKLNNENAQVVFANYICSSTLYFKSPIDFWKSQVAIKIVQ